MESYSAINKNEIMKSFIEKKKKKLEILMSTEKRRFMRTSFPCLLLYVEARVKGHGSKGSEVVDSRVI